MGADSAVVTMGQRGVFTMPKELREAYQLETGAAFTVLDLGGIFVLSPQRSQIDGIADRIGRKFGANPPPLEGILKAVREERNRYGTSR